MTSVRPVLDPLSLGKEKLQGGTTAVVLGSVSASLSQVSSTCVSFVVAKIGKNRPTHKVSREGKTLAMCIPEPGEDGRAGRTAQLWEFRASAS